MRIRNGSGTTRRMSACLVLARLVLGCGGLSAIATMAFGQAPAKPGDWPQWRGPNRDGISTEQGLLREWPAEGPKQLWQVDSVGAGYSSLAVKGGRIYTQGDLNGVEHALCLDAATGKTLWAVQPGPVALLLADRVSSEAKKLDRNGDGTIDELEALARFGWDFNKFDRATGGEPGLAAKKRAATLFKDLDKNTDGQLSFEEAANLLRDLFERIDAEDKSADAATLAARRSAALIKATDANADGKISREEARKNPEADRLFGRADMKDPTTNRGDEQLTAAELDEYFVKSQKGRDGTLSLDELTEHYVRSKVDGDGKLTEEELRGVFGGYRNGMGDGPRGTPTVDGDNLYVEGGNGDVSCLDAATGKTLWHVNLTGKFGGGVPGWGYSESPLVVDNLVIVTPGGKQGTLLALDKATGEKVWQNSDMTQGAHYSSPLVAQIAGTRQIVQFARESVFGVSIKDGKTLWQYKAPANGTANCCAPIVDEDLVFASSSYGTGGGLARITGGGEALSAEEVYFEKKMACHHGGIVKVGDYMYSNGGGALMCMNFKTGKIEWQARSVGKGSLLVADGMLYLFSENHEVALAEVTPEAYREHGRFKISSHGRPSWAHPVVADGKLLLRDQEFLAAYDLKSK